MRYARQSKIIDIIKNQDIDTQESLAALLLDAGFKVTQATVSRDIKDLQLIKTRRPNGKSCYSLPRISENSETDKLHKVLKETIISVQDAENLIVIKTLSGCANAAAEAIDTKEHPEIVGTLAGDNTILVIIDKKENVPCIMNEIKLSIGKQ